MASAGLTWYLCPQLALYREFRRSWQAGFEIRSWYWNGNVAYDAIPEFDAHIRKLWLASEDHLSTRNSEYVDVGIGAFPSYEFLSFEQVLFGESEPRTGLRPQVRMALGKYWMPAPAGPWGFDANLTLGHYFTGHPPGYHQSELITASLSLFYLL